MSPVRIIVCPPGGGGGGGGPATIDDYRLNMRIADANAAPTDAGIFTLSARYGDTNAAPTETSGLRVGNYADANAAPTDTRAARATWTVGATTASATGNWTNPTNAAGTNNGTNASLADAAANSNAGTLSLTPYPDLPTDFSTWTIQSARLRSYHAVTGWTGVDNNLVVSYDIGGGFVTMWTITANENFASTPRDFALPVLSAAQINNMQVRFVYTPGLLSNVATINVDAVHLEVTLTSAL